MTLIGCGSLAARFALALVAAFFLSAAPVVAQQSSGTGLAGTTLLIIRHAEKPADESTGGPGLTPAGEARARAYATYFRNFVVDDTPLRIDTLVATADSNSSMRPRLTVEPFSRASGLPLQQPFKNKDVKGLAGWLANGPSHRSVLIAWHHGMVPKLLTELGAAPPSVPRESEILASRRYEISKWIWAIGFSLARQELSAIAAAAFLSARSGIRF